MPAEFSDVLSVILYYIDDDYRKSHPDVVDKTSVKPDSETVLQTAKENKVSYYYLKRVLEESPQMDNNKIKTLLAAEEENLAVAHETLRLATSLLSDAGMDFLVLKTYKNFPYSTLDVDIVTRNFQEVAKVLEKGKTIKMGGRFLTVLFKVGFGYPSYSAKGLLNIDLYTDIPWPGLQSLGNELLWSKPRLVDVYGVKCAIPNKQADLLSLISTSLFTDRTLTLLDFLYVNSLLREISNVEEVLNQIAGYGWSEQFSKAISTLNHIKRVMYESEEIPAGVRFPYVFPLSLLFESIPGLLVSQTKKNPFSFPSTLARVGFNCFFGHIYNDVSSVVKMLVS